MSDKINNQCWVCGCPETYNVCIGCGVEIYLNTTGPTDTDDILRYIKENKPERFAEIMSEYEKDKKHSLFATNIEKLKI